MHLDSIFGGVKMLQLGGCGIISKTVAFVIKFAEGDRAYLRKEASRGLLRSVFIKKVEIRAGKTNCFMSSPSQFVPLYFDNLNACFNEGELISHVEAINLATAFYQKQADDAQNAIDRYGC